MLFCSLRGKHVPVKMWTKNINWGLLPSHLRCKNCRTRVVVSKHRFLLKVVTQEINWGVLSCTRVMGWISYEVNPALVYWIGYQWWKETTLAIGNECNTPRMQKGLDTSAEVWNCTQKKKSVNAGSREFIAIAKAEWYFSLIDSENDGKRRRGWELYWHY